MESQRHVLWNILPNTAFSLPPYLGLSDESCSPCAVLTEREFRLGAGGLFPRLCLTGPGWTLETPRPLRPEAQALLPQPPSPASAARSPTDPRKHRGSSSGLSEDRGTWLLPSPSVCPRQLGFLIPRGRDAPRAADLAKATGLTATRPAPRDRLPPRPRTCRPSQPQPPSPPRGPPDSLPKFAKGAYFNPVLVTNTRSLPRCLPSGSGYQIRVYFGKNLRSPHPKIHVLRRR